MKVETEIPKGVRKLTAGVIRVERNGDELRVNVQGDIDLASVSLFTGGKSKKEDVGRGDRAVVLKM